MNTNKHCAVDPSHARLLDWGRPSLVLFVIVLASCSRDQHPPVPAFDKPHVVLISLDTLRPDYLGLHGHPWVRTPHLDMLAAEAIVLEDCSAPAPTTLASHTSLFTGIYPNRHGVPRNGYWVHDDNLMLAEILSRSGFTTAGFVGSFALSSRFNVHQGFDTYDEFPEGRGFYAPKHRVASGARERNAASVTDAVIDYIESTKVVQPLFLFVHYFDAHAPYDRSSRYDDKPISPPNEAAGSEVQERLEYLTGQTGFDDPAQLVPRYAEQLSYLDDQIGRLIEYLRARNILDNAIVVLTSDHGESLWEHAPYFDHGQTLYQDTIRALGVLRLPNAEHGGTRITEPTSTLDLLPTVLTELNIAPPPEQHGNILPLKRVSAERATRAIFAEATKPSTVESNVKGTWPNEAKSRSVRWDNWKLIHTPYLDDRVELYDLRRDPEEKSNLVDSEAEEHANVRTKLRDMLDAWSRSAKPRPFAYAHELEADTREALEALGYN